MEALRSRKRDFKSGIFPSRLSKNAFAVANVKNNFMNKRQVHRSKESRHRDTLNNIISLIKEKEDSMIQSTGKQSSFFHLWF